MSDNFDIKVGESLIAGGPPGTAAEPEVVIGKFNGPFGTAFATLLGNQVKGHTKVLAIMNTDVMVRPATLMVSKVTVKDDRYTNILNKKYSVCLSFSDWSHYKLDQDLESLKQKLTEYTTNNESFK